MKTIGGLLTFMGFALAIPGMLIAGLGQILLESDYDRELEAKYR